MKLDVETICDSWDSIIKAKEAEKVLTIVKALRDIKTQIGQQDNLENDGTELLPSTKEALDSLEEIRDGKTPMSPDMREIMHTLMTAMTKEQKKQRIITLLKLDIEATDQMENKKATH